MSMPSESNPSVYSSVPIDDIHESEDVEGSLTRDPPDIKNYFIISYLKFPQWMQSKRFIGISLCFLFIFLMTIAWGIGREMNDKQCHGHQHPLETLTESSSSSSSSDNPTEKTKCPPSSSLHCHWEFKRYESSPMEKEWIDNIHKDYYKFHACERMKEKANDAVHWMEMNWGFMENSSLIQQSWFPNITYIFSSLIYDEHCQCQSESSIVPHIQFVNHRGRELIEPLWGILRDPFTRCSDVGVEMPPFPIPNPKGFDPLQSKRFILLASLAPYKIDKINEKEKTSHVNEGNWILSKDNIPPWRYQFNPPTQSNEAKRNSLSDTYIAPSIPPRRFLMDIGSSYYGNWQGLQGAAGTKYFIDKFHEISPPFNQFDKIIAMEYTELNVDELWKQIPPELMHIYSPINQGASANMTSKFNPWNILKNMAKKEDYVVVKLDIDNNVIENPLIDQLIMNTNEVYEYVDEFCFEHHVDMPEMRRMWKSSIQGTLENSYEIFYNLRKKGIRAHSWP